MKWYVLVLHHYSYYSISLPLTHCTPPLRNTRDPPRVDFLKKWRRSRGGLVSGRFSAFLSKNRWSFFNRWWKKLPVRLHKAKRNLDGNEERCSGRMPSGTVS